jgi:hypothetical protein
MVQLATESGPETLQQNSINANLVDQFTAERSRDGPRASSSLLYKPRARDASRHYVYPPPLAAPPAVESAPRRQSSHPRSVTRARGSSGIPPRGKLELSDLHGLSEDEFLQALQDDPELAAAVAEQVQRRKTESTSQGRDGSRRSQPPKRASRTTESPKVLRKGERIEQLQKDGVPVFQWIVVLALLGVALYQLYKTLSEPSAADKAKATRLEKLKSGHKKEPKNKARSGTKATTLATSYSHETAHENVDEQIVAELKDAVVVPESVPSSTAAPKKKPKKAKAKTAKKSTLMNEVVAPASHTPPPERSQPLSAPVFSTKADVSLDSTDGWQTVGGDGGHVAATETPKPSVPDEKPAVPSNASTVLSNNWTEADNVHKKKKKKKKVAATKEQQQSSSVTTTHDNGIGFDAQLALELQQQENLIIPSNGTANNHENGDGDEWAPVSTRKKRNQA